MNNQFKSIWIFLVLGLTSCFDKEEFPDTPSIAFESLIFFDGPESGPDRGFDSLKLTFSFEDGNGDVGLQSDFDILPPFNEYNVYLDSRDTLVTLANVDEAVPPIYLAPLITQNWELIGLDDNVIIFRESDNDFPIMAFAKVFYADDVSEIPRECPDLVNQDGAFAEGRTFTPYVLGENLNLIPSTGPQAVDTTVTTILVDQVERFHNIIIEFQEKVGENYVPIDFSNIQGLGEGCRSLNGRIPWFDPNGKSGRISYNMSSIALRLTLLDKEFRHKFFIYDRAGNKSNEVFTPDYVLADITQ